MVLTRTDLTKDRLIDRERDLWDSLPGRQGGQSALMRDTSLIVS